MRCRWTVTLWYRTMHKSFGSFIAHLTTVHLFTLRAFRHRPQLATRSPSPKCVTTHFKAPPQGAACKPAPAVEQMSRSATQPIRKCYLQRRRRCANGICGTTRGNGPKRLKAETQRSRCMMAAVDVVRKRGKWTKVGKVLLVLVYDTRHDVVGAGVTELNCHWRQSK